MTVDFVVLKTELANDPLSRGYAGMTEAQAASSLTTKNRPVKIDIPGDFLRVELMIREAAVWDKIIDAAANHGQPAGKLAAQGFVDAVRYINTWPTSDSTTLTALAARLQTLVDTNPAIMTAGQRSTLLAFADGFMARSTELGINTPSHADVYFARNKA